MVSFFHSYTYQQKPTARLRSANNVILKFLTLINFFYPHSQTLNQFI